jgi:hypothetical protein
MEGQAVAYVLLLSPSGSKQSRETREQALMALQNSFVLFPVTQTRPRAQTDEGCVNDEVYFDRVQTGRFCSYFP